MLLINATPPDVPAATLPFGGVGVAGSVVIFAANVGGEKRFFRADSGAEVTGAPLNDIVPAPNATLSVFPPA